MRRRSVPMIGILTAMTLAGSSVQAQQPTRQDGNIAQRRAELVQNADQAIDQLRRQNPAAAELLGDAYGHAVFEMTKGGLIVTGGGGTGVARNALGEETFMHIGTAGVGLGGGFERYQLVVLLEDQQIYDEFAAGQWDGSFAAQAAAGSQGLSAEEQFLEGVRVYRLTDVGVIALVDAAGVHFWASRRLNDDATIADRRQAAAESREARYALAAAGQAGNPERLDELTAEQESLATFVEAVRAAGLADSLTGETEYTVFAPTNDAFASMSERSVEELLRPENRQELVRLLRAHIVADDLSREAARSIAAARTIDGGTVDLAVEGGRFTVGEASVVDAGIQSGNLRVYAIDRVLSGDGETTVAFADEDAIGGNENENENENGFDQANDGAALQLDGEAPLQPDDEAAFPPGDQDVDGLDRPASEEGDGTLLR